MSDTVRKVDRDTLDSFTKYDTRPINPGTVQDVQDVLTRVQHYLERSDGAGDVDLASTCRTVKVELAK